MSTLTRAPGPMFKRGYNPANIPGLYYLCWASDSGWAHPADNGAVSSWRDATGQGRDLTPLASPRTPPTYRATEATLNNQPALDFNGIADVLFGPAGGTSQPYTIFGIINLDTVTDCGIFGGPQGAVRGVGINTSGSPTWSIAAITEVRGGTPTTGKHLLVAFFNGGSSTLKVDGSTVISGNPGTATFQRGVAGNDSAPTAAKFFDGKCPLVGMLPRAFTGTEETDLRSWATAVYGTP